MGKLTVEYLLEKLDFHVDEDIDDDFFNRNLLIKSNNNYTQNINFYFSNIRDYLICFHYYKLEQLNENDFYDLIPNFFKNSIGVSAISFYYENASLIHKQLLIRFLKDQALNFVNSYNLILEKNFKTIKACFNPYTDKGIGILLPENPLKEDFFAFTPVPFTESERVIIIPKNRFSSDDYTAQLLLENNINTIYYGVNHQIFNENPYHFVLKNISDQLKEIIEGSQICFDTIDILLFEQVSTIFYFYNKDLGYQIPINDYYLPQYSSIYPIDLVELNKRIIKFIANELFKRPFHLDTKTSLQKIEESLSEKIDLSRIDIHLDFHPLMKLLKLTNILQKRGHDKLSIHYLPYPDVDLVSIKSINTVNSMSINQIVSSHFSNKQSKKYIESFFLELDLCYKEVIETYFPTLKHGFSFYNSIPHDYYVYIRDQKYFGLGYKKSYTNETKVYFKEYSSNVFIKDELDLFQNFSLFQILRNVQSLHVSRRIKDDKTPKIDEFCILRSWIDKLLSRDIIHLNIFEEL